MLDEAKAEKLEAVIAKYWPEAIEPAQIGDEDLAHAVLLARAKLLESLEIEDLS